MAEYAKNQDSSRRTQHWEHILPPYNHAELVELTTGNSYMPAALRPLHASYGENIVHDLKVLDTGEIVSASLLRLKSDLSRGFKCSLCGGEAGR